MHDNDDTVDTNDKRQLAMSPLLSHEERMNILLGRTEVCTSISFKENKAVVSYNDLLLKAGENVNNENNIMDNDVKPPEDVFVNKAGEHIIQCEKKWFKKKQSAFEAQLSLTERRVIRGLKQSLQKSRDEIRKEFNASMFQ